MKIQVAIALGLLAWPAQGQVRITPADRAAGYSLDHVVVKFRTNDVSRLHLPLVETGFGKWLREKKGGPTNEIDLGRPVYCRVPPGLSATGLVALLKKNPAVEYAEVDHVGTGGFTPNDTYFNDQWHLRNSIYTNGPVPSDIRATNAWDITQGASNVILAVIDTGINLSEPDFAGRLVPGYDFVNDDADPSDDNGHGTAVAGTAAATGNNGGTGAGVAGVNWQCRIMPVKTLDSTEFGLTSVAADGIDWARTNGAKVINLSSGWFSPDATLAAAISNAVNAGMIFVTITHNDGGAIRFPGSLGICITVGATETNDHRASFSNYGPEIDLVAPGTNIWTVQYDDTFPEPWWGTSLAAPQVSGVAAMLAGMITNLNQEMARTLLCAGADDQVGDPSEDTPGFDNYYGWGRLNAWATLQLAMTMVRTVDFQTNGAVLSWSSPSNASNKQPYRIEYSSDLTGPWVTNAVTTNLVFTKTNTVWTDSGGVTQRFYRVRIDEN